MMPRVFGFLSLVKFESLTVSSTQQSVFWIGMHGRTFFYLVGIHAYVFDFIQISEASNKWIGSIWKNKHPLEFQATLFWSRQS
jgi:hypothetical protein